jgi:hypothetical protein
VLEAMGKLPVIRKDQKPFGMIIEASHGKQACLDILDKVFGFVKYDRNFLLRSVDEAVIDSYGVFSPSNLGAGFENHLSIYLNSALTDKFFRLASRGDTGPSYDYMESFGHASPRSCRSFNVGRLVRSLRSNISRKRLLVP